MWVLRSQQRHWEFSIPESCSGTRRSLNQCIQQLGHEPLAHICHVFLNSWVLAQKAGLPVRSQSTEMLLGVSVGFWGLIVPSFPCLEWTHGSAACGRTRGTVLSGLCVHSGMGSNSSWCYPCSAELQQNELGWAWQRSPRRELSAPVCAGGAACGDTIHTNILELAFSEKVPLGAGLVENLGEMFWSGPLLVFLVFFFFVLPVCGSPIRTEM